MTSADRYQSDMRRWQPRFSTDAGTRLVRPELPNNFDAAQHNRWGIPTASEQQYQANNRAMYNLVDIPPVAPAVPRGWQSPSAVDALSIAGRYGGDEAMADTSMNILGSNGWQPVLNNPQAPMQGPPAPTSTPSTPAWFQSALADASERTSTMGGVDDPISYKSRMMDNLESRSSQNAQQRWSQGGQQEAQGSTISPQRRSFWRTGRIDASSAPDVRPAPVRFNNSPSGWSAY